MEGHILSSIFDGEKLPEIKFPAVALLISGGHTELVLMKTWASYKKIGETRDDAVGEAFDKTARMLGLPYPGGPEIGRLARGARETGVTTWIDLPRPMLDSGDFDFSFSGLKTSVRYAIEKKGGNNALTEEERMGIARDFEESVTTVLLKKTTNAVSHYGARTVIVGGGVSASTHIREEFGKAFKAEFPDVSVYFPPRHLSTDNSIMIALAGHAKKDTSVIGDATAAFRADGNMELA
jgi:N6-L-threonylcarbamoyladenine synthase